MLTTNSTTLQLPPIEVLGQAAAEMAARMEGTAAEKAINKAIYFLTIGIAIVPTTGGFLVPSANTSEVYRVSNLSGCSCKGYTNHGHCYHEKMIAIIEQAQTRAVPSLSDRIAARRQVVIQADDWGTRYDRWSAQRKAEAEMDELFN